MGKQFLRFACHAAINSTGKETMDPNRFRQFIIHSAAGAFHSQQCPCPTTGSQAGCCGLNVVSPQMQMLKPNP